MFNIPRGSSLPVYSYTFISEISGAGVVVTSDGALTSKDAWAYKAASVAPYNTSPTSSVAPQTFSVIGQNAAAGFAATGGDVNLVPGVGSVGNSSGNAVIKDTAGNSGWNTAHLRMGIYHIWVDSSSRLRIKNSSPISDTDGTVIGTQT